MEEIKKLNDLLGIEKEDNDIKIKSEEPEVKEKKSRMPSEKMIKDWFGHIKELHIQMFIIDSHLAPLCKYCEAWKENTLERRYMRRLHELLGLREDQVFFEEVLCDWNCLHATEYLDPKSKEIKEYPLDLDRMGEDYFIAYGMDIDYFPAIHIKLISSNYKKGGEEFEVIFQALGKDNIIPKQYRIFEKLYETKVKVQEVNILKPIIKFLRSLNAEDSSIPIHEKFSLFLGQAHRHIEE